MEVFCEDKVSTVHPEGIVFKVNGEAVLALRMEYPKSHILGAIEMEIDGEGEYQAWGLWFCWEHPDSIVYRTMVFLEELVGLPIEEDDDGQFVVSAHDVTIPEIEAMLAFGTVPVDHYEYTGERYCQNPVEQTS